LDALEKDCGFLTEGGIFPQRLIDIWIENKRKDSNKFKQYPHPFEYQMYYDL
jgi:glutamine synthetase